MAKLSSARGGFQEQKPTTRSLGESYVFTQKVVTGLLSEKRGISFKISERVKKK